jgi:ABC-2 type transport system permease protein
MILWGFITQYFKGDSSLLNQAAGLLISGVLLWDVLFRSQLGVSVVFFEELHSRNLGHLFVSPLRPYELICALMVISLMRTLIGVGAAAGLAVPFYGYSILEMGLPLLGFLASLMVMGWSVGLMVAALVLRHGVGAESIAWIAIFALAPISGIYYPIATLPDWLQPVALALPSSHVFEGMRAVLLTQTVRLDFMFYATLLNGLYLGLGVSVFLFTFRLARQRGLLFQSGE